VAELIRTKDWSQTPLGPLEQWSESLRTTVSLILASLFPINLIWGDGAVQIWNDAYAVVCAEKHPVMFGSDYRECWRSAWSGVGAAFESARAGRAAFLENQPMFLDRNGYLEETWFTFSMSPIRDQRGEIAGLFLPVTETSAQILSDRRARTLRVLSARAGQARTISEAVTATIAVLAEAGLDVSLALVYLRDDEAGCARLKGHAGVEAGTAISLREIPLDGELPVAVALREGTTVVLDDLVASYGSVRAGSYKEPVQRATVVPIVLAATDRPTCALVLGFGTRVPHDESYRSFLDLITRTVSGALTSAHSYEQERVQAEARAELDRAKTTFFSNVSHELRTPLTLMLGPLEDELAERGVPSDRMDRLVMVHRNGMRLLRLVNSLLDFSRVESGTNHATFLPTDLAAFTDELSGLFRYAVEAAGLRFAVDCEPLPEVVFVDQEMWEKIVLNLLSNAFKHTFEGEIAIALRWRVDHVELLVSDTGIGVPAEEMPKLFDRFHRVKDAPSRTLEGTGIGLALVQELARRQGGDVTVESQPDRGTTFTVIVPTGPPPASGGVVSDTGVAGAVPSRVAAAHADEALQWVLGRDDPPPDNDTPIDHHTGDHTRGRVLLADDNADMRRHVERVLAPHFDVETAPDGVLALESARTTPPDLVLTDVMMPRMDGFELLAALRKDDRTSTIPVIMLSARAGEEASIEGVRAGVDDYLVKPFSAEELIARVSRSLTFARTRRESDRRFAKTNAELTRALTELDALASTDPLTGLPNRRRWDQELALALTRARRNDQPLCIALLDLDDLKTFNDTHGHQAGDRLLKDAGRAWNQATRASDLVARFGGDEFALIMSDCPLAEAKEVLDRLRESTPHGQTCSAGLVRWDGTETAEALIGRADINLYQAKNARSQIATVKSSPNPSGRR
jgi:diguanylate cyclase (GGDEF)-like protein